jgi:hypothetical protein
MLPFLGSCQIRVLDQRIHCLGLEFARETHTVHSPAGELVAMLAAPSTVRVLLRRIEVTRASRKRQHKDAEGEIGDSFLERCCLQMWTTRLPCTGRLGALVPDGWETAVGELVPLVRAAHLATRRHVFLICGRRNVAKSSIGQLLLNRALQRLLEQSWAETEKPSCCCFVRFLESDVGQNDFTSPGLLSLHDVSEPCLGPPHAHLGQPVACRLVGELTPAEQPTHYIDSVISLLAVHERLNAQRLAAPRGVSATDVMPPPLVINTVGWPSGLGAHFLADVIAAAAPTHIIWEQQCEVASSPPPAVLEAAAAIDARLIRLQALSAASETEGAAEAAVAPAQTELNKEGMDAEGVGVDELHSPMQTPAKPAAHGGGWLPVQEACRMRFVSYLGALPERMRRLPGQAREYVQPRWQAKLTALLASSPIALRITSSVIAARRPIHAAENVALCLSQSTVGLLRESPPADKETRLTSSEATANGWASHECDGLALVRSVDAAAGLVFVHTPVPFDRQLRVSFSVSTGLPMPRPLLMPTAITPPSPHLADDAVHSGGAGAKDMQSRHNIVRSHTYGAL